MQNNQNLNIWLAGILSVSLTLIAGVLHGQYSHRWGPAIDLLSAASQLETLPKEFGNWQLREDLLLEDSVKEMLECAGYVNRRYFNRVTGEEVTMAVIVGPPGPIAVHTPEICYSSRSYENHTNRKVVSIGNSPQSTNQFWSVAFQSNDHLSDDLRVYYAWSSGKRWEASESPRYEFAAEPMLFKIQLACAKSKDSDEKEQDSCRDLLEALLNTEWQLSKD